MRAPGLVKLTVFNCRLLDKYADFNTSAEKLGDWMRVQDMRDCVWLNDPQDLERLLANSESISSQYDCGQDSTLVSYIYRNISDMDLREGEGGGGGGGGGDGERGGEEGGGSGEDPCDPVLESVFQNMSLSYPADLRRILKNDDDFARFMKTTKDMGGEFEDCGERLAQFRSRVGGMPEQQPSTTVDPERDVVDSRIALSKIKTRCLFEHLEVISFVLFSCRCSVNST